MTSKGQSVKKKSLAPLKKKIVNEKTTANDERDEFEFTDDLLLEVFDNPALSTSLSSHNESESGNTVQKELLDLDDWIPKVFKQPKIEKPADCSLLQFNKYSNKKQSDDKEKTSFRDRREMLFSSMEFEPDSTILLRFLKRNVPAVKLKELSVSSQLVRLTEALRCTSKNWFTAGVVSEFSEFQKGGSGRIDVTDLTSEPYILRVLLFGAAFSEHKNLPVGTIVCIINPKKAKPFNGKEAMSVNESSQVLVAGTSRDFGLCSGKKKTGGPCRAVVNMNICRYCSFHAMAEFKEQRMSKELKAAAAGVGLGVKSPASPGLWNAQASKAPTLVAAKKNITQIRKDKDRLDKLNCSTTSSSSTSNTKAMNSTNYSTSVPASSSSKSIVPTLPEKRKFDSLEPSSSTIEPTLKKPFSDNSNANTPMAQQPACPKQMSAAKRKALAFVRENGSIAKEKLKSPIVINKEVKETSKPAGISEEFLAMMKEKPRDATLLNDAEALERDKKFERLKVVEEIGEKLAATHEVPVRAIRCLVCKKTYHQMPMQCVMNKHGCKVVTGTNRYFECNSCRNRTTTLERLPAAECSKCGVWSWKRAGVGVDRVCSVAAKLSVRGLEEKFVGSVDNDPNLSLLVPENVTE